MRLSCQLLAANADIGANIGVANANSSLCQKLKILK
jgi:hypothetical protein